MVTVATAAERAAPTHARADTRADARATSAVVEELRRRGARGGVIQTHRAMVRVAVTPTLLLNVIALPLALTVANLLALPWITDRWGDLFRLAAAPLGFPANVGTSVVTVGDLYAVAIPFVHVDAAWPTHATLVLGAVATAVAFAATYALADRLLPVAYAVRTLCGIQAISQLYFALASPPFAYRLPDYLVGFASTGAAVVALLPLLLGVTFFMFQLPMWRKLLLTVLLVGHLAALFPLHVLVHAYLVRHASLLALPLLYLGFGLLLETFVFVAFYGWGASWAPAPDAAGAAGR